jgi:integron integrase
MEQISQELLKQFDSQLKQNSILPQEYSYYKKWLRYYIDFCVKYNHPPKNSHSLPLFINKLREKQQSRSQQKQAYNAILIYYGMYDIPLHWHHASLTVRKGVDNASEVKEDTNIILNPDKTPLMDPWETVYSRLRDEIRIRHYSPKTLKAYANWVGKFRRFVRSKSFEELSSEDVKQFLTWLAVERKCSASAQNQAFNGLLFFFRHILKKEFGQIDGVVRAKRKPYIPVVLSRDEINRVVDKLRPPYDLIVCMLYGCGLRLSECMNIRINALNFDHGLLTVHDGKGKKDRTLPLPEVIVPNLLSQVEVVKKRHLELLEAGYDGVFMFDAIDRKFKNAAKEFNWQWLFPAKELTYLPEPKEYRLYHLHDRHVQKAIKSAANRLQLTKRVTAHTFRHSFASHLLQANYDIRTIQAMLGHSDVRTTMIYTQTVPSRTLKEAKSPLDISSSVLDHKG